MGPRESRDASTHLRQDWGQTWQGCFIFERVVDSLGQYEVAAERAGARPNKTATSELRERLRYLDITLEMIRKATGQLEETMRAELRARDALEWFERSDWVRILTETFYFNTGRIGQLLKHPT